MVKKTVTDLFEELIKLNDRLAILEEQLSDLEIRVEKNR
jgi:hypothetical protein